MCRKPGLELGERPVTARLYGITVHHTHTHTCRVVHVPSAPQVPSVCSVTTWRVRRVPLRWLACALVPYETWPAGTRRAAGQGGWDL
eukprot:3935431-Prymnesium_polylepis.1